MHLHSGVLKINTCTFRRAEPYSANEWGVPNFFFSRRCCRRLMMVCLMMTTSPSPPLTLSNRGVVSQNSMTEIFEVNMTGTSRGHGLGGQPQKIAQIALRGSRSQLGM